MATFVKERLIEEDPKSILNFNVGLLGHVDSGKTSLAKALSTTASTACFDKNPQSKDRGITIDLGFSSFAVGLPEHMKKDAPEKSVLQYTLVDCPGHASLIKTIIGGAQIIDLMLLVIDVTKGLQTQTAECLVIGGITCNYMVIVLNKCDLLPSGKRDVMIEKMKKRVLKTLEKTKFCDSCVIPVSASPEDPLDQNSNGIENLVKVLSKEAYVPKRDSTGSFVFIVDHCFSIRGQGTVMTGTVLAGSIRVNENIEIPQVKACKKVKSIQMFRKPVEQISQGDRAGICVTQFDPSTIERGMVCCPGALKALYGVVMKAQKISYFKGKITTKSKFHITLGHETLMAKVSFFSSSSFDFNLSEEFEYEEELPDALTAGRKCFYALLEFEHSIVTKSDCLVIASKLDTDIHSNVCRLAFQGPIVLPFTDKSYLTSTLPSLKVFKNKSKEGLVERMVNTQDVICKNFFKKETKIGKFTGLKVRLSTGENGLIDGSFGQSGKVKVTVRGGLMESTQNILSENSKKKGKNKDENGYREPIKVYLEFKRYLYDQDKKMVQ